MQTIIEKILTDTTTREAKSGHIGSPEAFHPWGT
jgi:hypothetical protein